MKKRRNVSRIIIMVLSFLLLPIFVLGINSFLTFPFSSYKRITQYPDDEYVRKNNLPFYYKHMGVDYDAPKGEKILASENGKVIYIRDGMPNGCEMKADERKRYGYGNYVIVEHENKTYTLYAHMLKNSIKVSLGQKVQTGQVLGGVGNSGWSVGSDECGTFVHLHFEVRHKNSYGSIYNPYNLDTGCLFINGCNNPQLPNKLNNIQQNTNIYSIHSNKYSLDHLGWLDIFKDGNPETNKIVAGSFDGGKREGLHTSTNTRDGHVYYNEVWWDNNERGNGDILDRLYKLDPLDGTDKKVLAMTTGKFGGGENDILALTLEGDDKVYFYHNNRSHNEALGILDPHPGSQEINNLTTGDIDNDGKDELMLSVSTDDHIYIFDRWNGKTLSNKIGFLDAHHNNPHIADMATMDIDDNGYDELLVATEDDDHIYEYYFDKSKLNKWWKPWSKKLVQPFVKQGYIDAHVGANPKISNIAVGKFQGSQDHLAVTTTSDDHIYFYWGRDLGNAWGGLFDQKRYKNAFSWTESPIIADMAVGDFDDSGDDELAVSSYGNDHINFFGHGDGRGYVGYGGGEDYYRARIVGRTSKAITFKPGDYREVWVEYQNTGSAAWFAKSSRKITLRLDPQMRNSIFYADEWSKENIPVRLTKTEVRSGDKVKFKFKVKAPEYSGDYQESFSLYLGNKKLKNTNFNINIKVDGEKPGKISNLRGDAEKSYWYQVYTSDSTPSFKWDKARDSLSGMLGYYLAIDDPTPDGGWGNDWWIGDKSGWTATEIINDGWHTVALTSKDKLGNLNPLNTNKIGDAPYIRFMIDTVSPSNPQNIEPSAKSLWDEDISLSRRPYLQWHQSQDSGSGVSQYLITLKNSTNNEVGGYKLSASEFGRADNTWQIPIYLNDDEYKLEIIAQDKVGNESQINEFFFEVDGDRSAANSLNFDADDINLIAQGIEQSNLTVTIYNPDGYTGVELSGKEIKLTIIDDNEVPAETGVLSSVADNGDGTYSATYTAATKVGDGSVIIEARCTSCDDNLSENIIIYLEPGDASGDIQLNASPPDINADGAAESEVISDIITDSAGNTIADGEMFTVATSLGSIITPDEDASHPGTQISSVSGVITFTIRSEIWNGYGEQDIDALVSVQSISGAASGSVNVSFQDVQEPLQPILTTPIDNSFTNDNTPMISGLAEKNARVLIYKKQGSGSWSYHYYTYADSNGNYAYTFGSSLSDADWSFRVRARDAAGNTSVNSDAVGIKIDTVKPTISNNLPTGIIYHRTETISANYQDDAGGSGIKIPSAILKINGYTKPASTTGSQISYTNTFAESNQTYNVYVEVEDRAGNKQTKTWSFDIQIYSYFLSEVGSGYKTSIVPNWPNSNGIVPSPSWWEPSFDDSAWGNNVFIANQPPSTIPKADPSSEWIWGDSQVNSNETSLLRYRFNVPTGVIIDDAAIRLSAEDEAWGYVGYVNGDYFGKVPETISNGNPYTFGINGLIQAGQNLLAIQVSNDGDNRAGLSYTMTVKYHD